MQTRSGQWLWTGYCSTLHILRTLSPSAMLPGVIPRQVTCCNDIYQGLVLGLSWHAGGQHGEPADPVPWAHPLGDPPAGHEHLRHVLTTYLCSGDTHLLWKNVRITLAWMLLHHNEIGSQASSSRTDIADLACIRNHPRCGVL